MKTKFPKTVRIQNQTWRVEFCDVHKQLEDMGAEMEQGEHVLGFCDVANRRICVDKDMSDGAKAEVLMHEIGHAHNGVLPGRFEGEHDEQFARLFTSAVMDLLLNNNLEWVGD